MADARALYAALFPKGLQFLTLDFKDEWNESQQRLDHIAGAALDDVIEKLGGAVFLATLSRMHRAYGEALHITAPRAGGGVEPDAHVRQSLEATHMALRDYVAQVAATVRRADGDSIAFAERLLAPVSARAVDSYEMVDDDFTVVSTYR